MRALMFTSLTAVVMMTGVAVAQQGSGPVSTACASDMTKFCAGKSHENREMRTCLEANKAKVSAACKTALDTTGPGKGQGKGKAKN